MPQWKKCKYSIHNNNRFIFSSPEREGGINIQFTMIIDLFTPRLRKEECQYLIYNNIGIINLFTPRLRKGSVNFQFTMITDLFIFHSI